MTEKPILYLTVTSLIDNDVGYLIMTTLAAVYHKHRVMMSVPWMGTYVEVMRYQNELRSKGRDS